MGCFQCMRLPPFNTIPMKCWPSSSTCLRTEPFPQDLIAPFTNFLLDRRKESKYCEYLKNFKDVEKKKSKKEKQGSVKAVATKDRAGKAEKGH